MIYFGSDNNAGAHPRILEAMLEANASSCSSYGEDPWTAAAEEEIRKMFGPQASAFFVFTGTAANILGLKSLAHTTDGIICAHTAHINTDECGAPEANIGCKLCTINHKHGKITPEDSLLQVERRGEIHHSYAHVLSISQSTELGTLYSVEEIKGLSAFCKQHGLRFHMDGARLCNAAAALGLSPAAISTELGVDVVSFGGTKNGLLFGEAIITTDPKSKHKLYRLRKQSMQLMSKQRYLSAQFLPYLKEGLWRENALHANKMAALLHEGLQGLPKVRFTHPVEANAVFVRLPRPAIEALQQEFYFSIWDEQDEPAAQGGLPNAPEVRLMTAFNTRQEDVERLVEAVRRLARG